MTPFRTRLGPAAAMLLALSTPAALGAEDPPARLAGVLGGPEAAAVIDFPMTIPSPKIVFAVMEAAIFQTDGPGSEEGHEESAAAAEDGCGGEEGGEEGGCGGGGAAFCLQLLDPTGAVRCWAERARSPGWQRDPRLACPLAAAGTYTLRATYADDDCGDLAYPTPAAGPVAHPFLLTVMALPPDASWGHCGDGVVDPGESCDDGNVLDGDCCASDCRFDAAGTTCADDGEPCTDDHCDGAGVCMHPENVAPCDDGDACTTDDACSGGTCTGGTPVVCGPCLGCDAGLGCVPAPAVACRAPANPRGAMLRLRTRRRSTRDAFEWTVGAVADTRKPDLACATTAGPAYQLCVFEGVERVVVAARIPSDRRCGPHSTDACWDERRLGFHYRNRSAAPNGITEIALRAGAHGRARIRVRGHGPLLALDGRPIDGALTVQLTNEETGICWGATHPVPRRRTVVRGRSE